jgi:hypothetical protein
MRSFFFLVSTLDKSVIDEIDFEPTKSLS